MKSPKPLVLGSNAKQPHLPVKYKGNTYRVPLIETLAYTRFIAKLKVQYPDFDIDTMPETVKLQAMEAFLAHQVPKDLLQAFEDNCASTTDFTLLMEAWFEAKQAGEEGEGLGEQDG